MTSYSDWVTGRTAVIYCMSDEPGFASFQNTKICVRPQSLERQLIVDGTEFSGSSAMVADAVGTTIRSSATF